MHNIAKLKNENKTKTITFLLAAAMQKACGDNSRIVPEAINHNQPPFLRSLEALLQG